MPVEFTKRRVLVLLVFLTVFAGAGIGLIQSGDGGDAPDPPTVTVTPPEADAAGDGTPTGTGGGAVGGAATPTATDDGGASGAGDGDATGTDGDAGDTALSVTAAAADPDPVSHRSGSVERLSGTVETGATWTGTADTAVVVHSVWVPELGWTEASRRTVDVSEEPALPAAAATVDLVYATGARAAAFTNQRDGTTRRTDGYVAVTVVLFDDGAEVARERATDAFRVRVTNVASSGGAAAAASPGDTGGTGDGSGGDGTDGGNGDGGDGDRTDPVSLSVGDGESASIRIAGVVPGGEGAVRTTVSNAGSQSGRLGLTVERVADEENDLLEPEREAGDDDATGELSDAVSVRVSAGGDYLVGDEETWVRLSDLEAVDSATTTLGSGATTALVVEWRADGAAGNEIQSDAAVVDVRFVLTQSA